MNDGLLVVVSGPSGVGKTAICDRLMAEHGCSRVITMTTREPREGEQEGVDYLFVSREEFDEEIERGSFLEHAVVHGNGYGTPRSQVETQLARGETALLNIDVQGAATLMGSGTLMDRGVNVLFVFIEPPSLEVLEERLRGRGSDDETTIRHRLANARAELEARERYDARIVNDDLQEAVKTVADLIASR